MCRSLRDEIQRQTIERLRHIAHQLLATLHHAQLGQVRVEALPELSITVSRLPFNTDEEIDFERRHITPYPRENFEQRYQECFGEDRDTWVEWPHWWEDAPESYPLPTAEIGGDPWPLYEDHIIRHNDPTNSMIADEYTQGIYFLLEAQVPNPCGQYGDLATRMRFIDFTNWRGIWLAFNERGYTYRGGYDGGRKRWSLVDMYNLGQDDNQPGSWIVPIRPHHSCFLIDDENLSEGVLGSEILCISMIMSELMLSRRWDDHYLFPVFCYTFSGGHVRITQGVFDDNKLHLRQTDPIDIGSGRQSRDNVKMLLRWMLGKPSSDTKWVMIDDDREEEQAPPQDPEIPFEVEAPA